jgi:DNA mismatch repair protein MutL
LIQVTDNGCGMSDSDARLCFERHATSKIQKADDLFAIHTMGFRGEALASIAAIAQVELRTRQSDADLGTVVLIEGAHIVDQHPATCPAGTTMTVKNLFYNVPARRNFLKKDAVELSHIEETFRRITLIHPDIAFTFTHNGKVMYDLAAGGLLQRICGLFGQQYKERMYSVEEQTDIVKIKGFASRPEFSRKTRGEQYLFVNGRYIKHPMLSAAVEKAYTDLLPERSYPSYFIGLQVDPSRIDVNIHPTKTEVKFVDDHALFAILRSAVKKALGQFSLATELSFDTPEEFNIAPAPKGYMPPEPKISYNPSYNPFKTKGNTSAPRPMPNNRHCPETLELPELPEIPNTPAPQSINHPACMQVQGRYIVTPLSSGLAVIDQQRAHERVLYDRLMALQTAASAQMLLFPVQCTFSAADAELFGELLPDLKSYGFEIAAMGGCTFVVTATPTGVKEGDMQELFNQMLMDYKGAAMQKHSMRSQSLCASLARQMAIKAGQQLTQEEMQQLVADLFACPMAEMSPSGKKTITIVKPEEILK